MLTTRTPPCPCPKCGYLIDAASSVSDKKAHPDPGDMTLCMNCSAVLLFTEDMTVRETTEQEIAALSYDARATMVKAITAITIMHAMKGKPHSPSH